MQEGIEKDELVSRGEYFSARLMAEYLGYEFLDAAEWLKFRFDGTVDTGRDLRGAAHAPSGRPRVVIPGFYGVMPDGAHHAPSPAAAATSPARWRRQRWTPTSTKTGRTSPAS